MKILFVSESPLQQSGADFYAVDPWITIPLKVAARGHEVTLWAPVRSLAAGEKPYSWSWRVETGGMRIVALDAYNSFLSYYRLWLTHAPLWKKTADQIIQDQDVVVYRLPSPMISIVAACALRRQKPLVLMITFDIAKNNRVLQTKGILRFFFKLVTDWQVRKEIRYAQKAARVFAYSRELIQRHQKTAGDRVKLMQDPHISEKNFIDREDTCGGAEIRLLRVCWLIPIKGLEDLLRAVALTVRKGHNVRLELVGQERSPGYQESLEKLAAALGIRERVHFAGWVPYTGIWDVYARHDIQVVSSLAEGTPRCIVEGAACGLPLVATTAGGCGDVLVHEKNALLVSPGNPQGMADAIERLIADAALRRRLIKEGYQYAHNFTFENLGEQFLREIRQLVPQPSASACVS